MFLLLQWALFPFLQLAFQLGDVNALIANRTPGATLYGASKAEKATLVLGKVAHYTLLLAVPFALHGGMAALTGWAAYVAAQVSAVRPLWNPMSVRVTSSSTALFALLNRCLVCMHPSTNFGNGSEEDERRLFLCKCTELLWIRFFLTYFFL